MHTITKSDIKAGLKKLNIQLGMAVEVHCSLRKFGYVEGGANTLIEALMETVGENGSIIMPSLKLSASQPLSKLDKQLGLVSKIKILQDDEQPSAMGIVSDTFRKRQDVVSGDGVFRVSAWGKDAQKHSLGLQHIIETSGYALLLGVDIYKLTAMHYVEDILPKEIKDIFRPSEEALNIYPEDKWLIEAGEPPVKPWYTIQDKAYKNGLITEGYIGNCKCMFFNVQEVVNLYRQALEKDALGLYGIK